MSNPDEENQLSQTSTEGQSSSNDGKDLPYQVTEGNGYRGLADLMSLMPRMGMFRRFGFLNALNLLFYQAELMKLEQAFIAQLESDEKSSNPCKRPFSKDWNAVSATDSQRTMIAEIRTLLEKYNEQILAQNQLVNLMKPDKRDVDYPQKYLKRGDTGDIRLKGIEKDVWETADRCEVVALDAKNPEDDLTRWITGFFTDIYDWLIGQHIKKDCEDPAFKGSRLYYNKSVTKVVYILTIGLSSIFPISSILLLDHFEDNSETRLIILCMYTLAFSIIFATVSGAKRIEAFSASAAFAAVQVVFISQDKCKGAGK